MKNLILLICLCLLISCQKETSLEETSIELENLTIESLDALLPLSESDAKTKAIFFNENGEEITFDFAIEEHEEVKKLKSNSYRTEEFSAVYKNKWITDYYLCFTGFGNYSRVGAPPTFGISASIHQMVEPMNTLLSLNDKGIPIVAMHYETIELLDKEFTNVYSNFIASEFTAFSELYYNPTYGIVGFRDREDELYVFKEFEE